MENQDIFTGWESTIIDSKGATIDISDATLKFPPPKTYAHLETLRQLETYKDFSNWPEQRQWYHYSDFYLALWIDRAIVMGEVEFAGELSEILAVGQIQRDIECGYYKFTQHQRDTAKTLTEIREAEAEIGINTPTFEITAYLDAPEFGDFREFEITQKSVSVEEVIARIDKHLLNETNRYTIKGL